MRASCLAAFVAIVVGLSASAQSLPIERIQLRGDRFRGLHYREMTEEQRALLYDVVNSARAVTNTTLNGTRVAQRKVTMDPSGVTYRVYVLMELDKGAAKQALMDKVKSDANLYARFRASQAFTDLDAELKKIEDAKKNPPQL